MQIKTITTAAGVNEIDFGNDDSQSTAHFYWFKNLSDSTLYVSAKPNPVAGEDNVAELSVKGAASIETDEGKVYVLGIGKVEIHRTNSKFCPFELPSTGSGGGSSITIDSELSETSTNPAENRVITGAINDLSNRMLNPNLLINPDFRINQRGISGTFSNVGKYFVDRWRLVSGTVTVNSDGTLTLNGSICQPLENAVGANVTASVSAGTAVYDDTAKTFTITGNGDVISWAKLEYGNAATAFIPPDPAAELMKCYRFFYRVGRYISNPNYNDSTCRIHNRWTSRSCVYTGIILPVEMRIAPTVTISGTPWVFRLFDTTGSNQVVFDATKISVTSQKRSCGFAFTDDYFANAVDGTICSLAQGYTDFNAEIY